VRLEREPRAIVLRGTGGCGKSRLAEWLLERAQEAGAAEVLATTHQAVPDRRHGLARLVERHYRVGGLDAEATLARIEEQLRESGVEDPYEWRALASLVLGDEQRTSLAATTPGERSVLLVRMLARATRDRPAIVWLDDVQWGEASLALVQYVLAVSEALPVLFVLTARDEALAERPRERDLLGAIEGSERARSVRVGPLPGSDVRMLAERMLGLSSELAIEIEKRVDGHPLFALQLIGDWISKGLLVVGPDGFALRAGARTELPDDLHELWIGRVEQVLAGRGVVARTLLELAAVLGQDVVADEFGRACLALGHRFEGDLLEPLILHRMILPSETGWSFVHGLLRESLLRSARDAGRYGTLHRACAVMLEVDAAQRGIAERLAYHLIAAGDLEAALEPLARAARHRLEVSELEAALALCAERERLLEELGATVYDPRALEGAMVRAEAHRLSWDFDAAERVAQAALDAATRAADVGVRADAMAMLAHCARQKGDLAQAMSRNRSALGLYDRTGDGGGRARTLLAMAAVARQQSELGRAKDLYERAAAVFETLEDELGRASALLGLGNLHRVERSWDDARARYREARVIFERYGNQGNLAHCVNGLAEIARYEGDLDEAERGYRETFRIQTTIGSKASFIPRMNLGIVLVARRDFAGARRELDAVLAQLGPKGQRGYVGAAHALLL
nr:tetratricopeptide repeat protein [Myxococcota bacterium]